MGVWFFKVCEFCGSYVWCLKLFHSWVCVYLFPSSFLCFWSIWLMGLMIPSFFALLCLKTIFQLSRTIMTPFLFRFELGFSHTSKALLFIFILCALLTYVWIFVLCSEGFCWNHAKLDMFDVSQITHSDLGFYDDALWYMNAENVDRKLVEMMGRVNLGLNVRMVVMWVEKCEILRVLKSQIWG